jgi:hypothetical protein
MLQERLAILPSWIFSWQAALTPDPAMIPTEDIFLLALPLQPSAKEVSLTATIDNVQGLLFHSPEALLQNIVGVDAIRPKPTKKSARTRTPNTRKTSQRHSTAKK